jgi:hypothetical protein
MKQVTFTKIASGHGPLTKKVFLADDGSIQKQASAQLRHGHFETVTVEGLPEFAHCLDAATHDVAFCYGITGQTNGRLVREDDLIRNPDAIARTREFFGMAAGPGILMLDNDNGQVFKNTLVEFLWENVDFLNGINMLARPSSSSNLYHETTGKCLRAMVNQRAYVAVSDARSIPAIGKLIELELWLAGHGYYDISSAGTLLRRCTVDTSVWQPERLDFVGGAFCVPPLVQRHMSCDLVEGRQSMLDVRCLPKLLFKQEEQIRKIEQLKRAEVEPDRQRIRSAWLDRRIAELVHKGVNSDQARQSVQQAAEMRTLDGSFLITLETGAEIPVAELLANPQQYHGRRCRDPLEPDYHDDPRVAHISTNNGGRPFIYSHAHGGRRYALKRSPKTIQILAGESARCTDEISQYLSEQGEVYERGQALLEINQDGQSGILDTAGIKYLAGSVCNLVRFDKRSNSFKPTDLTDTIAQLIVGRGGKGIFRKLNGIISAPTMTPGGRIVSTPGYDKETGLLLLIESESVQPQIDMQPNNAAVQAAFTRLWHPVKDFPFDGDVSRSCMLAAMLTAVVRPCFPTAPAFGFDAPTQGAGKTKLAQCAAALATGRVESLSPPPCNDEETRKNIATALAKNRSTLLFDNIESQLKSPVLAALLTSRVWSDRLLGGNKEIEAANRMLILVTGNNLAPVGDIVRRLLTVRVDPLVEAGEVWKREFALDPLDYIVRNRRRLVSAALTLLCGYIAAGRPKVATGRIASFEEWDDLVRQTVAWLAQEGIPGLCDPIARLTEAAAADPEAMRLAALAQQWHGKYGSVAQPLSDVIDCRDLYGALKEVAADRRGDLNSKMLAAYLRKHLGKIVGGYKFERLQGRAHISLWRIVVSDVDGVAHHDGADTGDGGSGGFDGLVLDCSAIDATKINSKDTVGMETNPSNPPNPPPNDPNDSMNMVAGY